MLIKNITCKVIFIYMTRNNVKIISKRTKGIVIHSDRKDS